MKYLSCFALLIAILIPAIVYGAIPCCQTVKPVQGANCDQYWQDATWADYCGPPQYVVGIITGAWGDNTEVYLPSLVVSWGGSTYTGGGGILRKSDWCGSEGPIKRSQSGTSPLESVILPPKQFWIIHADSMRWCWMFGETPLLKEGGKVICMIGDPWESANNFCLNPTFKGLTGCKLSTYEVYDLKYEIY